MQFNQIIAHRELKHKLVQMVQKNRLSHALLFLGHEGSGALPMAIAFAQYILCEKVNPRKKQEAVSLFGEASTENDSVLLDDSCGECSSCIKVKQLIHPDLHFSYPAIKKDSNHSKVLSTDYIVEWREFIEQHPYENVTGWLDFLKENPKSRIESPANKQGNITVNECDDIGRKLSLKSFEGVHKILIMWMPEFLAAAGNKLLKLIEEPPANTIFILVASDESAILPTIISRTQLIKIPLYSDVEIEKVLIEKEISQEKAVQIAAIAEGNYLEALKMLHNTEEDWEEGIRSWLNVIWQRNVNAQIKWIEEISKLGREKQKQFLKYFIHLLQQALKVRYLGEENQEAIPLNLRDFAHRLNKMCSMEAQAAIIIELEKAMYYIERNANGKMLFHALTIRLYHIIKENSLILVH
jgi:DNA polymerase-3 subunit delta'